ncbi:MAG TPA: Sir2 family NAD-dependent protein deacetylase [Dehalococcoidia bacterium]|nr:Sir2 family NAD-dependent protein deacetylase [Dehalococcoidia bacterium]
MTQGKGSKLLEELIEEVANLIVNAKKVVVFTGAGISTESGIPDFRGPDGLWTKFDPEDFTYQRFVSDREARKRLWGMSKTVGLSWTDMKPNDAHYAVAELDKIGKLDCIITQNVDGLHQKAGVADDKVIQLHGNMQWAKCLSCGERWRNEEVMRWVEAGAEDPECVKCGGIIKPEGVFFGEAMPVWETMEAEKRSRSCDLCIVIGSSLVVYPAALMPYYALQSGAKLVIINDGPTELDSAADVRISERAGMVMSKVLEKVKAKLGKG